MNFFYFLFFILVSLPFSGCSENQRELEPTNNGVVFQLRGNATQIFHPLDELDPFAGDDRQYGSYALNDPSGRLGRIEYSACRLSGDGKKGKFRFYLRVNQEKLMPIDVDYEDGEIVPVASGDFWSLTIMNKKLIPKNKNK